jgi:hypothetical protein
MDAQLLYAASSHLVCTISGYRQYQLERRVVSNILEILLGDFDDARAAYNAALRLLGKLPRDRQQDAREMLLGNMEVLSTAERYTTRVNKSRCFRARMDPAKLARDTRDQMSDGRIAWSTFEHEKTLEETRQTVRTLRAEKKAEAAKAVKARNRQRRKRRQRQKKKALAAIGEGAADHGDDDDVDDRDDDGDDAEGGGAVAEGGVAGDSNPAAGGEAMQECPICCEELGPGDEIDPVSKLQCSHSFHAMCIDQWLGTCVKKNRVKTCPYCREEVADL